MELAAAAAAKSASAWDQPGTLGFLVVFGMAVVLYFVFRSMSRHLRRINAEARAEALAAEAAAEAPGADPLARSTAQQAQAASASERKQS